MCGSRWCISLAFIAVLWPASSCVFALPDFGRGIDMNGIWIYPDNLKRGQYYYSPPKLELATKDGAPIFNYSIFRFLGTKETRTENEFRVRGVLSFEIKTKTNRAILAKIKQRLSGKGQVVLLRPLPVERFVSKLQYNTIDNNDKNQSGVLTGSVHKQAGTKSGNNDEAAWESRKFIIGLNPLTSQLFWDNFKKNNLQLSFSYRWVVEGMVSDSKNPEKTVSKEYGDSFPILVSMKKYPNLFERIESWQKMNASHTSITVICYDFINEKKPDLYLVTVKIKYKNMRGNDSTITIKYRKGDDQYEKKVNFRLARLINNSYEYRITRLYMDGSEKTQTWKKHDGFYLDVSMYK